MRIRTSLLALAASLSLLAGCGDDGSDTSAPADRCSYPDSQAPVGKEVEKPPANALLETEKMTIQTSAGPIGITLDSENAPCTVNSFVSLAEQGYYDGVNCHRLVPGFVLQCGDPTGTGTAGPGYTFDDELTGNEKYPTGVLAMANSGPNTNGSQFFIVLADEPGLDPLYTVFGSVDDAGIQVAKQIEAGGVGPDGQTPATPVTIESVS